MEFTIGKYRAKLRKMAQNYGARNVSGANKFSMMKMRKIFCHERALSSLQGRQQKESRQVKSVGEPSNSFACFMAWTINENDDNSALP